MRYIIHLAFFALSISLSAQTRYDVSSTTEFFEAHQQANAGDSIVWKSGIYYNTKMEIDKDGIIVTAEPYGTVLFTGVSRVLIYSDNVTFSGIQYVGGFVPSLDVMRVYGSDVLITHVNIQNYTCHKYLVVYEESRRTTIRHCNFENRLNLDDKNILSILVDDEPGYHKVQYCSFKNFNGFGQDQGIEPIRIGVSSQGDLDSRTLVEYCYFTRCNGDGEIISHKSRQNVYRYNTFEDNPVAELVLRHGDEGIVYGNFFLNNMGGIRVREGSHHFIYNNYFEGLNRRSIFLQNDPSDPLSDVHIYHNTIVDSEEFILGGVGSFPPANVTLANNVFTNPKSQLFEDETGNETWFANYSSGTLGIDNPSSGLSDINPNLFVNDFGYFQPEENSPVIASSVDGYPSIPLYPGMEYDHEINLDLMKSTRSSTISERAIGASEYSNISNVQPHATELNTGPSYLFDNLVDYVAANATQLFISEGGESRALSISSNIDWIISPSEDWISSDMTSGNGDAQIVLTFAKNNTLESRSGELNISGGDQTFTINIFQDPNDVVSVNEFDEKEILLFPNPTNDKITLSNLPSGNFPLIVKIYSLDGKTVTSSEYSINNGELEVDMTSIVPGTYLLKVIFLTKDGEMINSLIRQVLKK